MIYDYLDCVLGYSEQSISGLLQRIFLVNEFKYLLVVISNLFIYKISETYLVLETLDHSLHIVESKNT